MSVWLLLICPPLLLSSAAQFRPSARLDTFNASTVGRPKLPMQPLPRDLELGEDDVGNLDYTGQEGETEQERLDAEIRRMRSLLQLEEFQYYDSVPDYEVDEGEVGGAEVEVRGLPGAGPRLVGPQSDFVSIAAWQRQKGWGPVCDDEVCYLLLRAWC